MIPFRSIVASQMVRVHQIHPDLAAEHVASMDRKELLRRFKQYAGTRWAGLGLPLALALPKSAEPRTIPGETEGHESSALNAIAVRSPSGGGGGGVDLAVAVDRCWGEKVLFGERAF